MGTIQVPNVSSPKRTVRSAHKRSSGFRADCGLLVSNFGVNLRSQHVGAVEELGELGEGGGDFVG
jgi:hypothetical protein